MFQQPDTFGVHAGTRQIHDFGDAVTTIRAGGLDIRQVHVGAYVHAQRVGDAVHHFTHAEGAGAAPRSNMPTRTITLALAAIPASTTGFSQSRAISSMSSGMEWVWNLRTAVAPFASGALFLLFAHIPHYYSLPPPPAIVRRSNLPRIGQCLICCPIFGLYRWTTWRTIWTS